PDALPLFEYIEQALAQLHVPAAHIAIPMSACSSVVDRWPSTTGTSPSGGPLLLDAAGDSTSTCVASIAPSARSNSCGLNAYWHGAPRLPSIASSSASNAVPAASRRAAVSAPITR